MHQVSAHCFGEAKRHFEQAAATVAFCELPPALVLRLLREEELQARYVMHYVMLSLLREEELQARSGHPVGLRPLALARGSGAFGLGPWVWGLGLGPGACGFGPGAWSCRRAMYCTM